MTHTAAVPSHWKTGNIRRFAQMKSGHTPSRSVSAYWENTDIPWFTLADVWQLRDGKQIYLGDTANKINELGLANSAAELLPAGTVVLSRTASVGFSGIMSRPMATSQDFWNWVCGTELLPEYLNYQFRSMTAEFKSLNMGSTHQTIYQKDAATLQIVVPPLEEQRAIAAYLDREIARIDMLIEEQQVLVGMLQERRVATVAEALNGHEMSRLRRLVDSDRPMTYGILQCGEPVDGGVAYIGPSDITGEGVSPKLDTLRTTTPEIASVYQRSVLVGGDVVVSIGPAYGKVAVVSDDLTGANLTQDTVRVALRPDLVDTRFVVWALLSRQTSEYWDHQIMGATFRRLNLGTLARTPIPLPSIDVQRRIAASLDERTSKIDLLIAESARFIELARERRAALITAAVTGQIDVLETA
ncbi:hypothetical protein Rhe02_83570 [Rhizocola hellebori]|uniref:Type I restriction modification DNA specificity domain-containing protein n=1 Tax=Rhizocola hellebori TaxID=1392758 RepID=A0A8J3QG75_9ACTN|nr:restriction endonuclease subunit S [Rhizocola hellebori]GIH10290.1 hypothetical protein Rhe02_83570 [Rhizocola hellebori]